MQLSLLDQLASGPDPRFGNALRRDLGRGAWVEFVPGWVRGERQLGQRLLRTANWERHRRNMYDRIVEVPRLMAGPPGSTAGFAFGEGEVARRPSAASSEEMDRAASDLAYLASLLSVRYERALESVTLAYYRDGRDSVGFHGDKLGALRRDTIVAIVSLGAPRTFLLRPARGADRRDPSGGGEALTFRFGGGDLLVMGGTCQETYEHAVPKMAHAGPRIAVMFRERLPGPDVSSVRAPVASGAPFRSRAG